MNNTNYMFRKTFTHCEKCVYKVFDKTNTPVCMAEPNNPFDRFEPVTYARTEGSCGPSAKLYKPMITVPQSDDTK